ncbi:MAG: guanylate kinase [Proteobacteria bacterium]|nr:guanylate kinase [Pseudomonadota bacterium]
MKLDKKKGHLFVVSGPSGAGKSTLIRRFLAEDHNSTFSVSYTTREKRQNETNGKDYYFVDIDTFKEMIHKNGFLEWENVYNYLYGTPKKEVFETLERGLDIVLDIDVKGALNVKNQYPYAYLIFIEPPSREELIKRLSLRGEKEIGMRMQRVEEEIDKKGFFDYTIINENIKTAYNDFIRTIGKIRGKTVWQE